MALTINRVIKNVKAKKLRMAFAESVTCGMIASKLNTIKGTGDFFAGSIVCYDTDVKIGLLKVSHVLILKYSPVSKQVTEVLCRNLSRIIKADIYGAVTGLSTPDKTIKHPTGTIFLSVYIGNKIISQRKRFNGTPLQIRKKAVKAMLLLIESAIK